LHKTKTRLKTSNFIQKHNTLIKHQEITYNQLYNSPKPNKNTNTTK
jgi:hypothetical protein